MDIKRNKQIVRHYDEVVVNQGNLDAIDELCTSDYKGHVPGFPEGSREVDKQAYMMLRSAFPDINKTVEDMVAEGDTVMERATYRGTHQGDFQGIPPTGRQFAITVMHVFRIEGDKIAETWGVLDLMGMMQQLGVMPTSAAAVG